MRLREVEPSVFLMEQPANDQKDSRFQVIFELFQHAQISYNENRPGEMVPQTPLIHRKKENDMAYSLAELLAAARQMLVGLSANAAAVAPRGLTADFISRGQALVDKVQRLENEQETAKSALRTKTAELEAAEEEMKNWQSEASSTIKIAYRGQAERWLEFGIKAKK
jgi:hypothetical protein